MSTQSVDIKSFNVKIESFPMKFKTFHVKISSGLENQNFFRKKFELEGFLVIYIRFKVKLLAAFRYLHSNNWNINIMFNMCISIKMHAKCIYLMCLKQILKWFHTRMMSRSCLDLPKTELWHILKNLPIKVTLDYQDVLPTIHKRMFPRVSVLSWV